MPSCGVGGPPVGGMIPAVPYQLDGTESILVPKVNQPGVFTLWWR